MTVSSRADDRQAGLGIAGLPFLLSIRFGNGRSERCCELFALIALSETSILTPSHSSTARSSRRETVASSTPLRADARMVDTEAAARVMSETAHDLRSPLTSVREAVRLVRDGEMGAINIAQRTCLDAAIDQCDCIDQMIGEMVQLERLRTGCPRANRGWVEISTVRRLIDESLRRWAQPRNVDILWDIGTDPHALVFADASLLHRLIVNLATNAIRASRGGTCVLIRLTKGRNAETLCWSVIDQGSGISEHEIARISNQQLSLGGGEGLGLSICRQLAAAHFSPLQIRSRLGVGTEASFETPALGPRSVASVWSRWRVAARGPLRKPGPRPMQELRESSDEQRVRLDPPTVAIELSHQSTKPRCEDRLAAGIVTLGAAVSREAADKFDRLLQSQLQMFELVYRSETRRWVWVFDADDSSVGDRIAMITDSANAEIGGVRMAWTEPQMIPIDSRRTSARLSDLMVRESLAASSSSHISDHNEVRLGSAPLAHSDVAVTRLDAELRRLSGQMRTQTAKLRQQARNLRPRD